MYCPSIKGINIIQYRCIDWLIDAYEAETFRVSPKQKVPLEKIFGLYLSPAEEPGKNYLSAYKIQRPQLEKMRSFVDNWITEYNLSGVSAYQIHEIIKLLGKENIEILGLEGMARDYVKTIYSSLTNFTHLSEKRRYANHILRLVTGLDMARGKLQMLGRVVNEGNAQEKRQILDALTYDNAELVYMNFKNRMHISDETRVEKARAANLAESTLQGVLPDEELLEKLYPEEKYELEPEFDPEDGKLLDELLAIEQEAIDAYVAPRQSRKHHRSMNRKPISFTLSKYVAKPGDMIFPWDQNPDVHVLILSGAIYVVQNRNFYRADSPFVLTHDDGHFVNPTIYSADRTEFTILSCLSKNSDPIIQYALQRSYERLQAAHVFSNWILEQRGFQGLASLFCEDYRYSRQLKKHIIATPQEVLQIVAGTDGKLGNYLNLFGDSIIQDNGVYSIHDFSKFHRVLDTILG